MATIDDRMELIGSAILGQAQHESRELIDKANAERERELSDFDDKIKESMFGEVQAKSNNLRQASISKIAKNKLEAHRALLAHRNDKIEEILNNVRKRLVDHAKTGQYTDDILNRAAKLKDGYDHSDSVIMVAESEMPLAGEIIRVLGNGTAETDTEIKLGGFKLRNKKAGVLIDETLDERLSEQKLWLLENCGLKIN